MIIDKGRLLNSAKKIINTEKNTIKSSKNLGLKNIKQNDITDISSKLKVINKQINELSTDISSFQSVTSFLSKLGEYIKNHSLNESISFFKNEINAQNNKLIDTNKILNSSDIKLFENNIKNELDKLKSEIETKTGIVKELNISLENISAININSKNEATKIINSVSENMENLYNSINNININNLFDLI